MKLKNLGKTERYGLLFLFIVFLGGCLIYLLYDESFRMLDTAHVSITQDEGYWTSDSVTITINYNHNTPRMRSFSIDGGRTWQRSNQFVVTENKDLEVVLRGRNGRKSKPLIYSVENIDKEAPVIDAPDVAYVEVGRSLDLTTIFDVYDVGSGLYEVTVLANDLNVEVIGTYDIEVHAVDLARNKSDKMIRVMVVEAGDERLPERPTSIDVAGLRVSVTRVNLVIGTATVVQPFIRPANATNQAVRWESLNESVATVDPYGRITAIRVGEATIRAITVEGEKISEIRVFVTSEAIPVRQITLDRHTEVVTTEVRTITLTATIDPAEATNQTITWSSNNHAVATVTDGIVTIVGEGQARITAVSSNGRTAFYHLEVIDNYTFQTTPIRGETGHILRVFRNGRDVTATVTRIAAPFELAVVPGTGEIRLTLEQSRQIEDRMSVYTTRRLEIIRQR